MAINMSCSYDGCPQNIKNSCDDCPEITYWCNDHSDSHENETDHQTIHINKEKLNEITLIFLKSKIDNYIIEILNDTERVITALKKASNDAIKRLKETAKNIKNITELEPFRFSKERISFLVDEVGQISKDMKISPLCLINDLQREVNDKDNLVLSFEVEISELKQEVYEKEQILQSVLDDRERESEWELEILKREFDFDLYSDNIVEKFEFFWGITGEYYRIHGWVREGVKERCLHLLFSNNRKYCFFCIH